MKNTLALKSFNAENILNLVPCLCSSGLLISTSTPSFSPFIPFDSLVLMFLSSLQSCKLCSLTQCLLCLMEAFWGKKHICSLKYRVIYPEAWAGTKYNLVCSAVYFTSSTWQPHSKTCCLLVSGWSLIGLFFVIFFFFNWLTLRLCLHEKLGLILKSLWSPWLRTIML